jgi:hypothetical protein
MNKHSKLINKIHKITGSYEMTDEIWHEVRSLVQHDEVFVWDYYTLYVEDKALMVPTNKMQKIKVDLGIGKFITDLTNRNFITLYSCFGHCFSHLHKFSYGGSYLFLYCLDSDKEMITNLIKKYFKPKFLEIDKDKESEEQYWLPLEDGRKPITFRWE